MNRATPMTNKTMISYRREGVKSAVVPIVNVALRNAANKLSRMGAVACCLSATLVALHVLVPLAEKFSDLRSISTLAYPRLIEWALARSRLSKLLG